MGKIEVGAFSYDTETKTVSGPAEYMRERGNERIDRITSGKDTVFNAGVRFSAEPAEKLLLVSLQTDYAGWKGTRELLAKSAR